MVRKKQVAPGVIHKDRLLFFDLLKVLFIAIIVYDHSQLFILRDFNGLLFSDGWNFYNIYINGLTGIAVYGMFFISGAVLEYSYKGIGTWEKYYTFIKSRVIRLYPAFWMSLILGLALVIITNASITAQIFVSSLPDILFEYTGYYVLLNQGPGLINNMSWFIAAIVSIYLIFPLVSDTVRKYRIYAIVAFMIVSFSLRVLLLTYAGSIPQDLLWRWFPLCNLFEFGLGIYIIQAGIYPKIPNTSTVLRELVDLSFYVFLFHMIVIWSVIPILPKTGPEYIGVIAYFLMMAVMLAVCWIVMTIDKKIQKGLRQSG